MRPPPRRTGRWVGVALALAVAAAGVTAAAAAPVGGQDLREVAGGADGTVRLAFPAAPNVCGTGDAVMIREPGGSQTFIRGRMTTHDWRAWRDGTAPCRRGDVVVEMTRRGGGWTDLRMGIGVDRVEADPGARDLGFVSGQAAADALLEAARASAGREARELIVAAALAADAVTWPTLLEMARDRSLERRTREAAVQWLGRQAVREAAEELGGLVRDRTEDDEIREAAVFALSQLPDDQAIPILIDLVERRDDPRIVSRALFWLAELDDPRAVAVFEAILRGPGG